MVSNSVTNYLSNVMHSVKFAAIEVLEEQMPITTGFVTQNKDVAKQIFRDILDSKQILLKTIGFQDNVVFRQVNNAWNNLKSDLKSGVFYHDDRSNPMEMMSMLGTIMDGFGGDSEMGNMMGDLNAIFSGEMDFDDEEGEEGQPTYQEHPEMMITRGDALITAAIFKSDFRASNCVSKVMTQIHHHDMMDRRAVYNMQFQQNEKAMMVQKTGWTTMVEGFNKIIEFNNEVMRTHAENSQKYYEEMLKTVQESNSILQEIHTIHKKVNKFTLEEEKKGHDDPDKENINFGSLFENGLNLQLYRDVVTKRIAKTPLAQIANLVKMLPMFIANLSEKPLHELTKYIIKGVIGGQLMYAMKRFDQVVESSIMTGLARLYDYGERLGTGIKGEVAKVFGIKLEQKNLSSIDTSKYHKDSMSWNGIAQKALVEVIPGHLARIEATMTGNGERYYDFDRGKWNSMDDIKRNIESIEENIYQTAISPIGNRLDQMSYMLKKSVDAGTLDKDKAKEIEEALKRAIKGAIKHGTIDPQHVISNYAEYGLNSDNKNDPMFGFVYNFLNTIPRADAVKMTRSFYEANRARNSQFESASSQSGNILSKLVDNSLIGMQLARINPTPNAEGKFERYNPNLGNLSPSPLDLTVLRDERGKTLYDYQDLILMELYKIRNLGGMGGSGTGGPGGGDGTPPTERELSEDIEKKIEEKYRAGIGATKKVTELNIKDSHVSELEKEHIRDIERAERIKKRDREKRLEYAGSGLGKEYEEEFLITTANALSDMVQIWNQQAVNEKNKQQNYESSMFDFAKWFKLERDELRYDKYHKLPDGIDPKMPFIDQLLKAGDIGQKFDVIRHNIDAFRDAPATMLASVLGRAEDAIYNLLFEKESGIGPDGKPIHGVFDKMMSEIEKSGEKANGFLNSIIEGVKDLFGEDGLFSFFSNKIKQKAGVDLGTIGTSIKETGSKFLSSAFKGAYSVSHDAYKAAITGGLYQFIDPETGRIKIGVQDSEKQKVAKRKKYVKEATELMNANNFMSLSDEHIKALEESNTPNIDEIKAKRDAQIKEAREAQEKALMDEEEEATPSEGAAHGLFALGKKTIAVSPGEAYIPADGSKGIPNIPRYGFMKVSPGDRIVNANENVNNPNRGTYDLSSQASVEQRMIQSTFNGSNTLGKLASKFIETYAEGGTVEGETKPEVGSLGTKVKKFHKTVWTLEDTKKLIDELVVAGYTADEINQIIEAKPDERYTVANKIIDSHKGNKDFSEKRMRQRANQLINRLSNIRRGNEAGARLLARGVTTDKAGNVTLGDKVRRKYVKTFTDINYLEDVKYKHRNRLRGVLEETGDEKLMESDEEMAEKLLSTKEGPITGIRQFINQMFGTDPKKAMVLTKDYMLENSFKMGKGGAVGALLGAVFPLGGPLMGAMVGAGFNLIKDNERLKEYMFGKIITNKDGKNERDNSGLFSKETQKAFEKYAPGIKKLGAIGTLVGLITPFGPLGGALIGAGASIIRDNARMNEMLFGKDGGLLNKDRRARLRKALPNIATATLGTFFLGPFGLLGSAAIGTGLGLLSTTEIFKKLMLGSKGKDGTRRGGLAGVFKMQVIEPLKNVMNQIKTDFADWFKDKLFNPVADGMKKLGRVSYTLGKSMMSWMGKKVSNFLLGRMSGFLPKFLVRTVDSLLESVRKSGGWLKFMTQKLLKRPFEKLAKGFQGLGNYTEEQAVKHGYIRGYDAKEVAKIYNRMDRKDRSSAQARAIRTIAGLDDMKLAALSQAATTYVDNVSGKTAELIGRQANQQIHDLDNRLWVLAAKHGNSQISSIATQYANEDTFKKMLSISNAKERKKAINDIVSNSGIPKEIREEIGNMFINVLHQYGEFKAKEEASKRGTFMDGTMKSMREVMNIDKNVSDEEVREMLTKGNLAVLIENEVKSRKRAAFDKSKEANTPSEEEKVKVDKLLEEYRNGNDEVKAAKIKELEALGYDTSKLEETAKVEKKQVDIIGPMEQLQKKMEESQNKNTDALDDLTKSLIENTKTIKDFNSYLTREKVKDENGKDTNKDKVRHEDLNDVQRKTVEEMKAGARINQILANAAEEQLKNSEYTEYHDKDLFDRNLSNPDNSLFTWAKQVGSASLGSVLPLTQTAGIALGSPVLTYAPNIISSIPSSLESAYSWVQNNAQPINALKGKATESQIITGHEKEFKDLNTRSKQVFSFTGDPTLSDRWRYTPKFAEKRATEKLISDMTDSVEQHADLMRQNQASKNKTDFETYLGRYDLHTADNNIIKQIQRALSRRSNSQLDKMVQEAPEKDRARLLEYVNNIKALRAHEDTKEEDKTSSEVKPEATETKEKTKTDEKKEAEINRLWEEYNKASNELLKKRRLDDLEVLGVDVSAFRQKEIEGKAFGMDDLAAAARSAKDAFIEGVQRGYGTFKDKTPSIDTSQAKSVAKKLGNPSLYRNIIESTSKKASETYQNTKKSVLWSMVKGIGGVAKKWVKRKLKEKWEELKKKALGPWYDLKRKWEDLKQFKNQTIEAIKETWQTMKNMKQKYYGNSFADFKKKIKNLPNTVQEKATNLFGEGLVKIAPSLNEEEFNELYASMPASIQQILMNKYLNAPSEEEAKETEEEDNDFYYEEEEKPKEQENKPKSDVEKAQEIIQAQAQGKPIDPIPEQSKPEDKYVQEVVETENKKKIREDQEKIKKKQIEEALKAFNEGNSEFQKKRALDKLKALGYDTSGLESNKIEGKAFGMDSLMSLGKSAVSTIGSGLKTAGKWMWNKTKDKATNYINGKIDKAKSFFGFAPDAQEENIPKGDSITYTNDQGQNVKEITTPEGDIITMHKTNDGSWSQLPTKDNMAAQAKIDYNKELQERQTIALEQIAEKLGIDTKGEKEEKSNGLLDMLKGLLKNPLKFLGGLLSAAGGLLLKPLMKGLGFVSGALTKGLTSGLSSVTKVVSVLGKGLGTVLNGLASILMKNKKIALAMAATGWIGKKIYNAFFGDSEESPEDEEEKKRKEAYDSLPPDIQAALDNEKAENEKYKNKTEKSESGEDAIEGTATKAAVGIGGAIAGKELLGKVGSLFRGTVGKFIGGGVGMVVAERAYDWYQTGNLKTEDLGWDIAKSSAELWALNKIGNKIGSALGISKSGSDVAAAAAKNPRIERLLKIVQNSKSELKVARAMKELERLGYNLDGTKKGRIAKVIAKIRRAFQAFGKFLGGILPNRAREGIQKFIDKLMARFTPSAVGQVLKDAAKSVAKLLLGPVGIALAIGLLVKSFYDNWGKAAEYFRVAKEKVTTSMKMIAGIIGALPNLLPGLGVLLSFVWPTQSLIDLLVETIGSALGFGPKDLAKLRGEKEEVPQQTIQQVEMPTGGTQQTNRTGVQNAQQRPESNSIVQTATSTKPINIDTKVPSFSQVSGADMYQINTNSYNQQRIAVQSDIATQQGGNGLNISGVISASNEVMRTHAENSQKYYEEMLKTVQESNSILRDILKLSDFLKPNADQPVETKPVSKSAIVKKYGYISHGSGTYPVLTGYGPAVMLNKPTKTEEKPKEPIKAQPQALVSQTPVLTGYGPAVMLNKSTKTEEKPKEPIKAQPQALVSQTPVLTGYGPAVMLNKPTKTEEKPKEPKIYNYIPGSNFGQSKLYTGYGPAINKVEEPEHAKTEEKPKEPIKAQPQALVSQTPVLTGYGPAVNLNSNANLDVFTAQAEALIKSVENKIISVKNKLSILPYIAGESLDFVINYLLDQLSKSTPKIAKYLADTVDQGKQALGTLGNIAFNFVDVMKEFKYGITNTDLIVDKAGLNLDPSSLSIKYIIGCVLGSIAAMSKSERDILLAAYGINETKNYDDACIKILQIIFKKIPKSQKLDEATESQENGKVKSNKSLTSEDIDAHTKSDKPTRYKHQWSAPVQELLQSSNNNEISAEEFFRKQTIKNTIETALKSASEVLKGLLPESTSSALDGCIGKLAEELTKSDKIVALLNSSDNQESLIQELIAYKIEDDKVKKAFLDGSYNTSMIGIPVANATISMRNFSGIVSALLSAVPFIKQILDAKQFVDTCLNILAKPLGFSKSDINKLKQSISDKKKKSHMSSKKISESMNEVNKSSSKQASSKVGYSSDTKGNISPTISSSTNEDITKKEIKEQEKDKTKKPNEKSFTEKVTDAASSAWSTIKDKASSLKKSIFGSSKYGEGSLEDKLEVQARLKNKSTPVLPKSGLLSNNSFFSVNNGTAKSIRFNRPGDTQQQNLKTSGCGPATIVNTAMSQGISLDPLKVVDKAKSTKEKDGGTPPTEIKNQLQSSGLETKNINGLSSATKALKNNESLAVMGKYGSNTPHWMSITGMSKDGKFAIVQDSDSKTPNRLYDLKNTINNSSFIISSKKGKSKRYGKSKYGLGELYDDTVQPRADYAYAWLTSEGGLTPEGAAAGIGNMMVESGHTLDPKVAEYGVTDPETGKTYSPGDQVAEVTDTNMTIEPGQPGYGIFQFTSPGLKKILADYAKSKNISSGSIQAQLGAWKEAFENPSSEFGYRKPSWDEMKTNKSPEELAEIWCNELEIPNPNYSHLDQRISEARKAYDYYKDKKLEGVSDPTGGGVASSSLRESSGGNSNGNNNSMNPFARVLQVLGMMINPFNSDFSSFGGGSSGGSGSSSSATSLTTNIQGGTGISGVEGEGYDGGEPMGTPYRISVHHTAGDNDTVESINEGHKNNGWACIGYHFVIYKDGSIHRGRKEQYQGAHTQGYNKGSLGITLVGNFEETQPTDKQLGSLTQLIADLGKKYSIPMDRDHVKGHGEWDVGGTACPGKNLKDKLDDIVAKAAKKNGSKESESGKSKYGLGNAELEIPKAIMDTDIGEITEYNNKPNTNVDEAKAEEEAVKLKEKKDKEISKQVTKVAKDTKPSDTTGTINKDGKVSGGLFGKLGKALSSALDSPYFKTAFKALFGDNFNPSNFFSLGGMFGNSTSGGSSGGVGASGSYDGTLAAKNIEKGRQYAESMVGQQGFGNDGCTEFVRRYLNKAESPMGQLMNDPSPVKDEVAKAEAECNEQPGDRGHFDLMWVPTIEHWAKQQNHWKDKSKGGAEGDICVTNNGGHVIIADGKGGAWGNSSASNTIKYYPSIEDAYGNTTRGYVTTGVGSSSVSQSQGNARSEAEMLADGGSSNASGFSKYGGSKYGLGEVDDRKKYTWDWLVDKSKGGLNTAAASGIMANIETESGGTFDPTIVEGGDHAPTSEEAPRGVGYGLVQYTDESRRQALESFSKNAGVSSGSLDGQLGFMKEETTTGAYSGVWNKINQQEDPVEAAKIWMDEFEAPDPSASHWEDRRKPDAQRYFETYAKGNFESGVDTSSSSGNSPESKSNNSGIGGLFGKLGKALSSALDSPYFKTAFKALFGDNFNPSNFFSLGGMFGNSTSGGISSSSIDKDSTSSSEKAAVPTEGNTKDAMQKALGGAPVTSPYGPRSLGGRSEYHNGIDYGIDEGTPLPAICDAVVDECGTEESGYSNFVVLKDKKRNYHIYGNLSDNSKVSAGQEVEKGTIIGTSGNTGASTGPHLHYGIYDSSHPSCLEHRDPSEVGSIDPSTYSVNDLSESKSGQSKYGLGEVEFQIAPKFTRGTDAVAEDEENIEARVDQDGRSIVPDVNMMNIPKTPNCFGMSKESFTDDLLKDTGFKNILGDNVQQFKEIMRSHSAEKLNKYGMSKDDTKDLEKEFTNQLESEFSKEAKNYKKDDDKLLNKPLSSGLSKVSEDDITSSDLDADDFKSEEGKDLTKLVKEDQNNLGITKKDRDRALLRGKSKYGKGINEELLDLASNIPPEDVTNIENMPDSSTDDIGIIRDKVRTIFNQRTLDIPESVAPPILSSLPNIPEEMVMEAELQKQALDDTIHQASTNEAKYINDLDGPTIDTVAPNGMKYTQRDVDSMMNKGITLNNAIESLSKMDKYQPEDVASSDIMSNMPLLPAMEALPSDGTISEGMTIGPSIEQMVEAQNKTNELLQAILQALVNGNALQQQNAGPSNTAPGSNIQKPEPIRYNVNTKMPENDTTKNIRAVLSTIGGGSPTGMGDAFFNGRAPQNAIGDINGIVKSMDVIVNR